jgi:hypothetical protein
MAALLPRLAKAGIDATAVEVETGLERATQALWATAAQVHASLALDLPPPVLAAFDGPDGPAALNELRGLARDVRAAAAAHLAERGYDAASAATLARAHREWDRRKTERAGFTNSPGDVLAFKHFRDAEECRREADKEAAIERGVKAADTDGARARLDELRTEAIPRVVPVADMEAPPLTVTRLARTDTLVSPVGVAAAPLGAATPADLAAAPSGATSGPFGEFGAAGGGRYVAIPAWTALAASNDPVAVPVPNCADVAAIVAALGADTPAALASLRGPGLLIVDRRPAATSAAPAVLVAGAGGALEITAAAAAPAGAVVASVLYVLRPPKVDIINDSDASAPLEL